MYIYAPALFALIVKFIIFFYGWSSYRSTHIGKIFLFLLLVMTLTNVLELLAYQFGDTTNITTPVLKIYYVSLVWLFALLSQITWEIINHKTAQIIRPLNYFTGVILSLFILFGNAIIAGSESVGYTVTRVPGKYFFVAQFYAISMLLGTILSCIYGYLSQLNTFKKIQMVRLLIAIISLAIPIFLAIAFMLFDIKITAAFFLPIGISTFSWITQKTVLDDDLFDIRILIPFFEAQRTYREIRKAYTVSANGSEMTAAQKRALHEKIYIKRALVAHKSQSDAAKALDVSESTVSKKRKDYRI